MTTNGFSIGIMQGRLSPPINGKIQSFPWNTWKNEFNIAADIGFDEIEFIFESCRYRDNPLLTKDGLYNIESLSNDTGIFVNNVCADYFIDIPFIRVSKDIRNNNKEILIHLIEQCAYIGIKGINIPFVDNSRIETKEEMEIAADCLLDCLPIAEIYDIKIALETSLKPDDFIELIKKLDHPLIGINYDTGNSAALGYDTEEELLKLGKYIYSIHIKDRILNGKTVPLGKGSVNFGLFFKTLDKISYNGSFILQASRGKNDIDTAKKCLKFVNIYIQKYLI